MKRFCPLLSVAVIVFMPISGGSEVLSGVPMQGSMVMPMLAYHAQDGSLTIQMDPEVPQLTPLSLSNPGDSFNPLDPWYDDLDPSRQGLAFSRRYGFVMDAGTDPLPPGTMIWIRNISGSQGLGAYRFRKNPRTWEPIFGTKGSTNALPWDGTMFHPAFTAPPVTGGLSATFEAFLLNTAEGSPVPGANTGPFEFNWTVGPDNRPRLCLERNCVLRWPGTAANYVLECTSTLAGPAWVTVTNSPMLENGQFTLTVETGTRSRFFRLRRAP